MVGGAIVFVTCTTVEPGAAEIGGGECDARAVRNIPASLGSSTALVQISDPISMT
jgi:hypothetical protein